MTDLPTFVNEPIGELRRATVRDELTEGMATLERKLPLQRPRVDRRRPARTATS